MNCMSSQSGNFQVDLGAIIELLSQNLYSNPGVYIRELVQNALDAMNAREIFEGKTTSRTISISPVGVATAESGPSELSIQDSGIGLSQLDVQILLATVGGTSKRKEPGAERRNYLGQFGIGLLSCFVIADQIVVVSQDAHGNAPIEWTGNSDGTFLIRTLDESIPVGTTVRLCPRPDMVGWAHVEQVIPLLKKYAEFLPVPIFVATRSGLTNITSTPPWKNFASHRISVEQGNAPIFAGQGSGTQSGVIRLFDKDLQLDGVVYIGHPKNTNRDARSNRVFVSGMLVDDRNLSILPSWATFAWAVIDSSLLEPTASRESIVENHAIDLTRRYIGQQILNWISEIAVHDPERFSDFISENRKELLIATTASSWDDSGLAFAKVIIPMLTVETTESDYRISEMIERSSDLLYADTVDEFRSISAFNPHGRLIINAGYTWIAGLLNTIPLIFPETTITRVYPAIEIEALRQPAAGYLSLVNRLTQRANTVLKQKNISVIVRSLPSPDIPSIFICRARSGRVEPYSIGRLRSELFVMNWGNRLVRALAALVTTSCLSGQSS